jgi:hypothetical protein
MMLLNRSFSLRGMHHIAAFIVTARPARSNASPAIQMRCIITASNLTDVVA